ncbi:hypothetical protein ACJ73_10197 [Blastomyces percursus]|uniref:Uncharacterized protein n=1 Tax=Blastomyces percursus TaxID=1658174 RepID=A0A1J9Q015_9EURO|nr:hypothetical protein ACJ73_10197 [Blastomyces percursus]
MLQRESRTLNHRNTIADEGRSKPSALRTGSGQGAKAIATISELERQVYVHDRGRTTRSTCNLFIIHSSLPRITAEKMSSTDITSSSGLANSSTLGLSER